MKVILENDIIRVYLYQSDIDINDIESVNQKIKSIFVKLLGKYNLKLFGYNKVSVYHNKNYGIILEIEKIYSSENVGIIDLKIIIYRDVLMYLEFDDYYFSFKPKNLIIRNNKYYLNVNDINLGRYLEYGKVIIKKNS